ncbi:unnamed protein product [Sphagnum tenellum]
MHKALAKIDHSWQFFDRKKNNKGPTQLASTPYVAITEGITNGADAISLLYQKTGKLSKKAVNVETTLEEVPGPHVDIYCQNPFNTKVSTITILDRGCGMDENGMIKGVLSIGSDEKQANPHLHGNYGQGSATLFGQSTGSVIASRKPGSDIIVYTFVFRRPQPDGTSSISYLTRRDGALFTANAKELNAANPNLLSMSQIASRLASYKDGLEQIIFPEHGTIRRQIGMHVQMQNQSKECLYKSLPHSLFGSSIEMRLIGDRRQHDNDRKIMHYKDTYNVKSARAKLLKATIGEHIDTENSPILYDRTLATKQRIDVTTIYDKFSPDVYIEVFAFKPYQSRSKDKPEQRSAVRHWLDGDPKETPKGILITLNGQVHNRLESRYIFGGNGVGLPFVSDHVIINVQIDSIPVGVLDDLLISNRESLKAGFHKELSRVIRDFVRNGPAADYLVRLNDELRQSMNVSASNTVDVSLLANSMVSSRLMGHLLGKSVPNGKPGKNKGDSGTGIADTTGEKVDGKGDKDDGQEPRIPTLRKPVVTTNQPTFVAIHKEDFVRGKREWLTVRTDANDTFDTAVDLQVPSGFTIISSSSLHDGRKSFYVQCDQTATDGLFTVCLVGTSIKADKQIRVVDKREPAKKPIAQQIAAQSQETSPEIDIIYVDGSGDTSKYYAGFGGSTENVTDFVNYRLDTTNHRIYIYLNTAFEKFAEMKADVERNYGAAILWHLTTNFPIDLTFTAMLNCDSDRSTIGQNGANSDEEFKVLERSAMAQLGSLLRSYDDSAFRKSIEIAYEALQEKSVYALAA